MADRGRQRRFGLMVEDALWTLPPQFQEFTEEVPVEVNDRPTDAQMSHFDAKRLLLGLYVGRPRTQRSGSEPRARERACAASTARAATQGGPVGAGADLSRERHRPKLLRLSPSRAQKS